MWAARSRRATSGSRLVRRGTLLVRFRRPPERWEGGVELFYRKKDSRFLKKKHPLETVKDEELWPHQKGIPGKKAPP